MPAFMSTADHEGRGPHRLPDIAVVDQAAAGLQPGPQEGIGRAAEQQPLFLREPHQLPALREIGGQGLFAVHMLAGQQGRAGHLEMLVRTGQVQHNVHRGIGKQIVHGGVLLGNAVLLHGRPRPFVDQIADAHDFQLPEPGGDILQIDTADGADAHDADAYFFHNSLSRQYILALFSNRSAVSPWSRAKARPAAAHSMPRRISSWAVGERSNTSS